MAVPTNTYLTTAAKGLREDLIDVIYNISPTDTPFVTNGGRGSAKATYHEWQTDTLATADTTNAQPEGNDAAAASLTPTVRLGNYTQISTKTVQIAGSLEAVDKAGRKSEMAYQMAKKGLELRLDIEAMACQNGAAVSGSTRKSAGIESFITGSNASRGATGVDPVFSGANGNGAPTTAPVDGTARVFTEALLKTVLQGVWSAGGTPKTVLLGAFNKATASSFNGVATKYKEVKTGQATVVGAVDIYVGDFGQVTFVPSRLVRAQTALVLDPTKYEIDYLRPFTSTPLAPTGDSQRRFLLAEWTLKVNAPAGQGVVADLTTA